MRIVTLVLLLLLAAIQYPLWFGKGGWMYEHDLRDQLAAQRQKNAQLKERNDRLAGEVQDLKDGTSAIEERARYELGMVKDGEVFVQFLAPQGIAAPRVAPVVPPLSASAAHLAQAQAATSAAHDKKPSSHARHHVSRHIERHKPKHSQP